MWQGGWYFGDSWGLYSTFGGEGNTIPANLTLIPAAGVGVGGIKPKVKEISLVWAYLDLSSWVGLAFHF